MAINMVSLIRHDIIWIWFCPSRYSMIKSSVGWWGVYYVMMMIMWSGNMIAHYIFMWEVFSFLARWKSNHDKLLSWAVDVIYFSVGGAWTNEWSPRRTSPVKRTDHPRCPKRQVTTQPSHFIGDWWLLQNSNRSRINYLKRNLKRAQTLKNDFFLGCYECRLIREDRFSTKS